MTEQEMQEMKAGRIADDQWNGTKLMSIAIATLTAAFVVIYVISGFNGGH